MDVVIKQGEDAILDFPILENGSPATLTGVVKILGVLKVGVTEVGQFSLQSQPGFDKLTLGTGASAHIVTFYIDSDSSKDYPLGMLTAAVAVFYPDVNFPDGDRKEPYEAVVGRVEPSVIRNQN